LICAVCDLLGGVQLHRVERELAEELGRAPKMSELAEKANINQTKVEQLMLVSIALCPDVGGRVRSVPFLGNVVA
jgi:Sigma-70 region 3